MQSLGNGLEVRGRTGVSKCQNPSIGFLDHNLQRIVFLQSDLPGPINSPPSCGYTASKYRFRKPGCLGGSGSLLTFCRVEFWSCFITRPLERIHLPVQRPHEHETFHDGTQQCREPP